MLDQYLATVIRYADCVKRPFRQSRRRLVANFTSFITRLLRLWYKVFFNIVILATSKVFSYTLYIIISEIAAYCEY